MGNVLHVELPVGLDEQQMQAISSTPDLRKRQPVSTNQQLNVCPSTDFRAGVGRLTSRAVATTDGLQCCGSPPLVHLGVSYPLGAHVGFWNLTDYDQPSDLVAARFPAPSKNTNILLQY